MKFNREYIRQQEDNQIVVHVPENTEVTNAEEMLGTVLVKFAKPVTKNLDRQFYMSQEEFDNYVE